MPTPVSPFLREAARRVLVFDGAMGTSIHARNLDVQTDYCGCENCTDVIVRTRPDVVREIHESFLAAGADAVETDTFGASRHVLGEFGLSAETFELNRAASEVARAACAAHATPDRPRFVVGSIGPGTKLITLGNIGWGAMLESYREQARGLLAGPPGAHATAAAGAGVDAFCIETCQDLLQAKCAINAVLEALHERRLTPEQVPIMVSVTIETSGAMLLGTQIEAAATALAGYPICCLGLNCATGPTEMSEHVRWLGRHWGIGATAGRVVSVMPNAGLPVLVEGRTEYPLGPRPFAEAMLRFVREDGVGIVGGCCGTTPAHIATLAAALEAEGLRSRPAPPRADREVPRPGVTSLYAHVDYRQDNSFLIVGERMNASGSKRFRQLLEAEDFDGIVSLAREQVRRDGAHVLDVNVDYAGRDNPRDMAEVVSRVVRQVDAPLMIDSTQLATIRVALEHAGGKCIINSTNFEDGTDRFDEACRLARQFGAALVIGCIDEDPHASMARTADRKEAIARRGYERAVGLHGLRPEEVFFDPLVLPVSTGMDEDRRSALELVEGVRRITRLFPRSQIVVGLSNVSFGLRPAARVVLNSALLHELRAAGLTAAIVHASKILPENRIPAEQWGAALDLIYDRRRGAASPEADPLQRFIALFPDGPQSAGAARAAASASAPVEDRLRAHIVDGEKEGLERTLEEALGRYSPLQVINDHLLDGMKTVGDLFGSGQMQLPFVLQSAEVMKRAVAYLQPRMERVQGASKGSIVLATVKGDVHDIGKNLVDIILSNNGYTVHNLGIKQPLASILEAWRTTGADAIGLSGLLVKSVNVMEENLRELSAQGIGVPVLVGGAALTRHYAESHLRSVYRGPCLYGKDAFDGLRIMEHLAAGTVARLESEIEARLAKRSAAEETIVRSRAQRVAAAAGCAAGAPVPGGVALADRPAAGVGRSPHVPALDPDQVPTPPFWGSRVVEHVPLAEVYPFINTVALFRGQWQVKKGSLTPDAYERLLEDEISPAFESLKARCRDENLLRPAVVYGYFPCNAAAAEGEGANQLVLFDPADPERELERFTFPRQASGKRLCISDYFLPAGSGRRDVIGLHCVTVGAAASEAARALFERDAYQDYLYLHGLSVETAEALAELWHKRIRQELGIAGDDAPRVRDLFTQHYRGSRYSFGYPACPEMADQAKLWRLLRPERIGCRLTETWQIDPEQSTSAIIVHHPAAKYFAV